MHFLDRLKKHQQFQLINIFIQYIKNYLYIIIYSKIALLLIDGTVEQNNCSSDGRYYIIIVENGCICFVVFNLIALIYIIKQQDFARLEFFIMYGLNLGWFSVLLVYSLITVLQRDYECNTVIIFRKAFLFVCIKKEIEIGALIFKQSDWFLRQVNICANTVFAFMIFTSSNQERCSKEASTIALSITIENLVSLAFFTVINVCVSCYSLKNQAFRAIKFVSIVIISSFVISYIVIMYFNATDNIRFIPYCVPIIFTMKSYIYVIPISLASMVILYYSLLLQYEEEQQEEEKSKSKNQQSQFNPRDGYAISPFQAQFIDEINFSYKNDKQNESEGRKTISNHAELEKMYKSGQLRNNDEFIEEMPEFQPNQGSTNNFFSKKQVENSAKSNQKQKAAQNLQDSPINFYDFADKLNERNRDQQRQNQSNNEQMGTAFNINSNINQFENQNQQKQYNKMVTFNQSQPSSQHQSFRNDANSVNQQQTYMQSGSITPSFNLIQKNKNLN
ncbi:transmembrane protein, putative (macronuclear) [Tetrahymena thermophila SB210]|uniref:Transmembrane protein, putative n=1 Tax=Tetrahymena thermophila (strain SB210) TaxID=312017 RepID=I7M0Q9_TETTS|nr:transmembrane protein, putative [Tetrahymena thermophila SB210]EAR90765.2 transmembrane protein, putative [Tetrahymena thermophila SB210]|eukprot:XP_001011010.2 transmembrane protein, putative [Tetrahymena thermophila SB210]